MAKKKFKNLITSYKNGDFLVHLFDDGTKIRMLPTKAYHVENPKPYIPESVDLCITHKCDGLCPFCYDSATPQGKHAELVKCDENGNKIFAQGWMDSLSEGEELALNANDCSHPELEDFLVLLKKKKVIPNLTINQRHFLQNADMLLKWQKNKLIYGIGISMTDKMPEEELERFTEKLNEFDNIVCHIIAGTEISVDRNYIERLSRHCQPAILFLGYKHIGKGEKFAQNEANKVRENLSELYKEIPNIIDDVQNGNSRVGAVSFDCLAFDQLGLDRILEKKPEFEKYYMGDDGTFTFYIDAVSKTFSKSSLDIREKFDIGDMDIHDMFYKIRSL